MIRNICILKLVFLAIFVIQASSKNWGDIYLKIGKQAEQKYFTKSAVLYENVSLDYDTTLHLQSSQSTEIYYSPQLKSGNSYILHLLVTADDTLVSESARPSLDIYFDLGDSLITLLDFSKKDSSIFLSQNRQLTDQKYYSRNEQGSLSLLPQENSGNFSGNFEMEFDYPGLGNSLAYQHIRVHGKLNILEENLVKGEQVSLVPKKEKGQGHTQIYTTILVALLIVFGFGLR